MNIVLHSGDHLPFYDFFMNWKTPIIFASLYTVSITYLNPKLSSGEKVSRVVAKQNAELASQAKVTHSSRFTTALIFLHNLALCLFSVVTFFYMSSGMVDHLRVHQNRFKDAYCDSDKYLWTNSLGFLGYLFYLSKYYEIIDTIIILLKGRRSSFLQTYHHAGAMITMWIGMREHATPIWIFVLFNSFIHSVMYAYYAATSIGFTPPGKKYLTSLQITQFFIGTTLAASYLFVPNCMKTPGQMVAIWVNVLYLLPLTYLFLDFARKMYGKRKASKAAKELKDKGKQRVD